MRNVYTVGQLNAYVKNMFTQDYLLQSLFVKGEVSNCKYHSSGHIYFTLKDSKGVVNCVMFAGHRSGLSFRLAEGQQVVVGGSVDVYERDGKYQLYAKQIVLDGAGLLYERFEQLKAELAECGMFAPEYKQPIPRFIRTLGVVTADTGAAVRDIIQIAGRRNPYVQIILYPAIVQGEAAAESIVRGIRALERLSVDVMIVGRGGGSIEDLWAFNERIVAQAVFDCSVPIISAVGHETDTTIIDFVSDLRAPTPSAAAELAVADIREILADMEGAKEQLQRLMRRRIGEERARLDRCAVALKYGSPLSRIRARRQDSLRLEEQLQEHMDRILRKKRHELDLYIERMRGLSPLDKLKSGFSYVEDERGQNLRSVRGVRAGQPLTIRMQDGSIAAQVTEVREESRP
ncbi:MAG: exodeoxyribonuclease VII large subunit [Acetatifactor sp.]|nr:exodeoxyribonuclease VII large subunit [Acetatifactor sp.]MDE7271040.1 exodeoxyribonuclease VII large subunit [Acetatifactor sp.]